jgi:16S rRNA (guanine966-N2)-methyltransferase
MSKIRIIAGELRSRLIEVLDDIDGLRPTPNRVRQTLFNWLNQDLTGKVCLDLFAGSGALGFEAISRGAKMVYMVESNRKVVNQLRLTAKILDVTNLHIVAHNALSVLADFNSAVDIIFLDPPYDSSLLEQSLALISRNPSYQHAIIYIEYQEKPNLDGYRVIKNSKAGAVNYALIKLQE